MTIAKLTNEAPDLAAPLIPSRQNAVSAAAESDQARAIAETQSMLIIAKRFPRDEIMARDKIMNACARKGLAEASMYEYSRGGTAITGPSIRLAEMLAASWGNMVTGWRELSRNNGVSEVEAYAWDLETNTRVPLTFQVKHWRDTKQGGYHLKDERDIYEVMANQAARRLRACILKLIPSDVVDDAVKQCETTLASNKTITAEQIKAMVEAFAAYGVTQEMIEAKIQRRAESITPIQMVQMGKTLNSIKDGMSKPADWFDMSMAKKDIAEAANDVQHQPAKKKAAVKHDPNTGEIQEQVAEENANAAESAAPANPPEFLKKQPAGAKKASAKELEFGE